MNNQPPKVLYETVGKLAGINVLFDPQMQPGKNANLDLNNVTLAGGPGLHRAADQDLLEAGERNAIFVTEDNVTKRRDYEDEVVKVFYLKNPTSVQEFQEIITAVRSVTDVRRMFTFNAAERGDGARYRGQSRAGGKACSTTWTSRNRKWWWT